MHVLQKSYGMLGGRKIQKGFLAFCSVQRILTEVDIKQQIRTNSNGENLIRGHEDDDHNSTLHLFRWRGTPEGREHWSPLNQRWVNLCAKIKHNDMATCQLTPSRSIDARLYSWLYSRGLLEEFMQSCKNNLILGKLTITKLAGNSNYWRIRKQQYLAREGSPELPPEDSMIWVSNLNPPDDADDVEAGDETIAEPERDRVLNQAIQANVGVGRAVWGDAGLARGTAFVDRFAADNIVKPNLPPRKRDTREVI